MDSNPHQMQHGLEPSCNLFSPPQSGVANAGWKAFSCRPPDKPCSSSSTSSKAVMQEPSADNFYRPDALLEAAQGDETLMVTPELAAWQVGRSLVDDSSLRCLLPGPAIEQPSQRLSLSLRKTKSSDSRLQQEPPFGLREGMRQRSNLRDYGLLPRTSFHGELQQQQLQSLLQECQFFPQLGTASSSSGFCSNPHQYLRNSQYLAPVQELLDEFCSLKPSSNNINERPNNKPRRQLEEGVSPSSCAGQRHRLLLSSDIMELKKRMAKLVSMLEELDRRYRMYCEQMKALVSSFEAAAGDGAARVYSTLASKAMSRHFRCLRDGIVGQISETKNAIGEKDPVTAPGMTRGETPRLRLLVRYIRQQKEFQYAGVMETHPWRPQRGLPERSVSVLRAWLFEHFLHPYPSDVDKHILARQTGLSRSQVCNWFINARVRLWKPMVEEMYSEETKEPALHSAHSNIAEVDDRLPSQSQNPNPRVVTQRQLQDDKKLLDGRDADSLSSVVVGSHKSERREVIGGCKEACFPASCTYQHQLQQLARPDNNFGVLDVDLSSGECSGQHHLGSSTVSLTLGLQQNNGVGMSFSFIPPSQSSLLFSKEAIDNYQPMQFSILDGDVQNPSYRNFVGAQMLHDLTG